VKEKAKACVRNGRSIPKTIPKTTIRHLNTAKTLEFEK